MIHRLALLMGGTGAAGVLALALSLGGFGAPLPNSADAFAPVANTALGGGLLPAAAPTEQPTMTTSLGGGEPQEAPKKVVDTVYVRPAVVHRGKPSDDANQPAATPRDNNNGDNNNGGNQAGDDQGDNSAGDDQNQGSDDQSNNGDHSDDGGSDDGGNEPGGD